MILLGEGEGREGMRTWGRGGGRDRWMERMKAGEGLKGVEGDGGRMKGQGEVTRFIMMDILGCGCQGGTSIPWNTLFQ